MIARQRTGLVSRKPGSRHQPKQQFWETLARLQSTADSLHFCEIFNGLAFQHFIPDEQDASPNLPVSVFV